MTAWLLQSVALPHVCLCYALVRYETLSDANARKEYDRKRQAAPPAPPPSKAASSGYGPGPTPVPRAPPTGTTGGGGTGGGTSGGPQGPFSSRQRTGSWSAAPPKQPSGSAGGSATGGGTSGTSGPAGSTGWGTYGSSGSSGSGPPPAPGMGAQPSYGGAYRDSDVGPKAPRRSAATPSSGAGDDLVVFCDRRCTIVYHCSVIFQVCPVVGLKTASSICP